MTIVQIFKSEAAATDSSKNAYFPLACVFKKVLAKRCCFFVISFIGGKAAYNFWAYSSSSLQFEKMYHGPLWQRHGMCYPKAVTTTLNIWPYSKTCVKWALKNRQNADLYDKW